MRKIGLSVLFMLAISTGAASAQIASAPVQKIGVAKVSLSPTCETFAARNLDYGANLPTAGGALLPVLGGLIGDVAGAGLDAIASALETASQEHAYGAEGRINFEFYELDATKPVVAIPRLGKKLTCLTLEVRGPLVSDADGLANFPPTDVIVDENRMVRRQDGSMLTDEEANALKARFALPITIALKLEAEIVQMRDGFYIRPVYIHYATRLPGAPAAKALPAELHIKLATPTSVNGGAVADTAFAIARIALPKLAPGDTWWAEQIATESALLPFRSDDGTTSALKLALTSAATRNTAREDLAAARVSIGHALGVRTDGEKIADCIGFICPAYLPADFKSYTLARLVAFARLPSSKVPADMLTALSAAEQAYAASILSIDQSNARLAAVGAAKNAEAGSTTLEARFIVTRSANKFGLAVANALKKQSTPLATAITGTITRDDPDWSQAKSDLALAKLTVTQKEQALARAKTGGDADAIEQADYALLQAKLDVNLKSSALRAPIPYPELGR